MKIVTRFFSVVLVALMASLNINATNVLVPSQMNPGTIIQYDSDLRMTIVDNGVSGFNNNILRSAARNLPNTIHMLDDLSSYTATELEILQGLQNDNLPIYSIENENIIAAPNTTVVYDGTGSIFKVYDSIQHNTRLTSWTYPANGTYYYGDNFDVQNWLRFTDDHVMGQGYVTYYYGEIGYHGDNLDQMEEDDPDLNICATKMKYDRPNRGQEIRLRVLDSEWADTDEVYYVNKYDVGCLPDAVLDIRERLFSEITDINNGIFHGRYYYEKVPLTDPY